MLALSFQIRPDEKIRSIHSPGEGRHQRIQPGGFYPIYVLILKKGGWVHPAPTGWTNVWRCSVLWCAPNRDTAKRVHHIWLKDVSRQGRSVQRDPIRSLFTPWNVSRWMLGVLVPMRANNMQILPYSGWLVWPGSRQRRTLWTFYVMWHSAVNPTKSYLKASQREVFIGLTLDRLRRILDSSTPGRTGSSAFFSGGGVSTLGSSSPPRLDQWPPLGPRSVV